MSRVGLTLLGLLLGAAAPVGAQTGADRLRRQDESIQELSRQRDSLGRLWVAARDLGLLQDSLAHAASVGRLDTIAVGSIRIITNRSQAALREAAERYWPTLDSLYGDAARQLEARPALFQMIPPDSVPRQVKLDPWGTMVPWDAKPEDLVNALRAAITMPDPDSALRVWLPGGIRPPFGSFRRETGEAYVALVTASTGVARRCFEGDIDDCRLALVLNADKESLIAAYRDPRERAEVVARLEHMFRQRRELPAFISCQAGSDSACIELLRSVPFELGVSPLADPSRQLLVHLALQAGGREAYLRLTRDPAAPIGARIAAAAAMPIDSLLARWRAAAIAGRPAAVTLPPYETLVGMGWIIVLGLFGMRSSRWRLE